MSCIKTSQEPQFPPWHWGTAGSIILDTEAVGVNLALGFIVAVSVGFKTNPMFTFLFSPVKRCHLTVLLGVKQGWYRLCKSVLPIFFSISLLVIVLVPGTVLFHTVSLVLADIFVCVESYSDRCFWRRTSLDSCISPVCSVFSQVCSFRNNPFDSPVSNLFSKNHVF